MSNITLGIIAETIVEERVDWWRCRKLFIFASGMIGVTSPDLQPSFVSNVLLIWMRRFRVEAADEAVVLIFMFGNLGSCNLSFMG